MITGYFPREGYELERLKTVGNERINEKYQEARRYDDKLFLVETVYEESSFFKGKKKVYYYDIKYRYLIDEYIDRGRYTENDIFRYLMGYIDALRMVSYWQDPEYIETYNRLDNG